MKNTIKSILQISIIILLLTAMAAPALATEYTAKFETQFKANGIWSSPINNYLNVTDPVVAVPGGFSFSLYQVTPTDAWFKYTPPINGIVDLPMKVGDVTCLKDSANKCSTTDMINSSDGAVKFTLLSITPRTDSTVISNVTSSDANPVYAYIQADKELPLTRNPASPNIFDVLLYYKSQQNGWTSGATSYKEVNVYFKRNFANVPVDVSVLSCSGDGCEKDPKYEWSNSQLKYIITKVGTYNFNVKYSITNPWGASTEKTDTYKVTLKGITGAAGAVTSSSASVYKLYLSDSMDITMAAAGTFTPQTGVGITPVAGVENKYTFKFETAGAYHIKYITSDGTETFVDFEVKVDPVPPSDAQAQPTVNTNGNQQQDGDGSEDNTYWVLLALIAVVALGVILIKRKRSGISPSQPKNI